MVNVLTRGGTIISIADVARHYWGRLTGGPYVLVHGIVVYQLIYFFNGFTEMEHGRLAVNGKVVIMAGKE